MLGSHESAARTIPTRPTVTAVWYDTKRIITIDAIASLTETCLPSVTTGGMIQKYINNYRAIF